MSGLRSSDDQGDRPLPAKKKGRSYAVMAVTVVVLILLICGGGWAAVYYGVLALMLEGNYRFAEMMRHTGVNKANQQEGKRFAEAFLRDIDDNRLDSAYQATSAAYQKRLGRKEFEAFLTAHPAIAGREAPMLMAHNFNVMISTTRFEFEYSVPQPGQLATIVLGVITEGGALKIDELAEAVTKQTQEEQDNQEQGKRFADAFLHDIRSNDLARAYQFTSSRHQRSVSREGFDDYIRACPSLKTQPVQHGFNARGTTMSYEFEYSVPESGKVETLVLSVVKEGDQWKIDQLEWH